METTVEITEMSQAEIISEMVSGRADHTSQSMVRAISQRVPVTTLSRVEAMANLSKKSRNAMINLLLEAGIDSVFPLLDKKTAKAFHVSSSKIAKAMLENAENLEE